LPQVQVCGASLKYPRLSLLAGTYIVVFPLAALGLLTPVQTFLSSLSHLGVFIGGFLYAYSFTAASATAILLLMSREYNFLHSGLIAGFGAFMGDIVIFLFVRHGLTGELEALSKVRVFKGLANRISTGVRRFVLPVVAGLLICSLSPQRLASQSSPLAGISRLGYSFRLRTSSTLWGSL